MAPDLLEGYEITTDPVRIDVDFVHTYLSGQSYWASGVSRAVVERSIAHSLCFSLHGPDGQVGFARVITDRATFAYLADVFVDPGHTGCGFGKALVATIMAHPDLQELKRFLLATADAHSLYDRFGFKPLNRPERFMERLDADLLQRLESNSQ